MKNFVAIVLIIGVSMTVVRLTMHSDNSVMMILSIVIIVFFIINLGLRRSIRSKAYFTSKYNVLTTKFQCERTYDIPQKLMFEKIKEVLGDSNFRIVDTNEESCEILALTSLTFKSWGENLYIELVPEGEKTVLHFCSVTLLQMYDWGKNEKNSEELLNEIEDSLVI